MLKKMEMKEVQRLRGIMQTKNYMRFIVGSAFYLDTVLDYKQPLFEFFKVIRLDGLDETETRELLLKLGEINGEVDKILQIIKETPERIETLRTLTGGVPRTIALMFNIFIEYNNEDTVKDLEKILDAVTPLYKHRMDDLPTQQQKIIDAVAKNWDGINVKELKEKLRIESKTISAQLRSLEKNQIIETVETNTKNHIYFLKERFFNIWYLMRYGRKYDQQRVIWLVRFLECWCTAVEIEQRIIDYVNKLKEGKLSGHVSDFYGEIYTAMKNISSEVKIILKESTPQHLAKLIKIEQSEILRMAGEMVKKKEIKNAYGLLEQIEQPTHKESLLIMSLLMKLFALDPHFFSVTMDAIIARERANDNEAVKLTITENIMMIVVHIYISLTELGLQNFEEAHKNLKRIMVLFADPIDNIKGCLNFALNIIILNFLAFNQENIVLSFFQENLELQDSLKPTYFAVLRLTENDEFLRASTEIKEKVKEVLAQVDALKNFEIKRQLMAK